MNEALINPFFSISHPTAIQTSLYAGATLAKFDSTGRFIAAARPTGALEIWDLETKSPVRTLDGHVKMITSVDWSRNSRYVLSASKDWNVLIWDLAMTSDPPQRYTSIRFDNPVVSAAFHPKNSRIIVVVLSSGEAFVCDLRKHHRSRTELLETLPDDDDNDDDGNDGDESQAIRSPMKVARFDPNGKNIFAGTASGQLLVFNSRTKIMVARHKVVGAGSMKGLDFTKSGRRLVTNSSDRTLRQFTLSPYPSPGAIYNTPPPAPPHPSSSSSTPPTAPPPPPPALALPRPPRFPFIDTELEPIHKFTDPINRTAWHAMAFSPDGEWLAGGAADQASHKVYIWDLSNEGMFVSALEGGREMVVDLHWHPTKSSLLSVSKHGNILIWHCPHPERWGAFAGGFEEVDENVEYEEKEDEFDIEDEEVILERKMKAEDEQVDIDTIISLNGPISSSAYKPHHHHHNHHHLHSGTAGVNTPLQGGNGNGNGNGVDVASSTATTAAALGKLIGTNNNNNVDLDDAWAEEEPDDDDDPLLWRMKVVMEPVEEGF